MAILFRAAAPLVCAALSVLGSGIAFAEGDAAPASAAPPASHAPGRAHPSRPPGTSASNALLPGFETLADGSTRLFVELSQPVSYEAKAAHGSLTYVLKGARPGRRNNTNPLVTIHFNTPVTSARLVPRGRDLWFVVALRADVQPTVTMDPAKDGGAVLRIDFPKGDYVPGTAHAASPNGAASSKGAAEPGEPPASSDDAPSSP